MSDHPHTYALGHRILVGHHVERVCDRCALTESQSRDCPVAMREEIAALRGQVAASDATVRVSIVVDNDLSAPGAYVAGSARSGMAEVLVNLAFHIAAAKAVDEPLPELLAETLTHELVHVAQDLAGYVLADAVVYAASERAAGDIVVTDDEAEADRALRQEVLELRAQVEALKDGAEHLNKARK